MIHDIKRTGSLKFIEDDHIKMNTEYLAYGDVILLYSIISRFPGSLEPGLRGIVEYCRQNGYKRIEGYVEPFMLALIQKSAPSLPIIKGFKGNMDGKSMIWTQILLS